jgi:NADPH:quinone reductase-like Zn-dependent oxidoreductase
LRYIGWPIIPGFDFSGVVEWAGSDSGFQQGEKVFGFSLFGAYSSRVIVDMKQIRKLPKNITLEQGAALPAVSATALHAISLSGGWPGPLVTSNKAALIHSAAGGVGSMLIQICKIAGYHPIVAVVGNISKAEYCKKLGADHVVVKSEKNWWKKIENISSDGYTAIFDANGLDTLFASYLHLSRSGRLVTYGFHSNLPKSPIINPISWLKLIYGLIFMPKFDPMAMVLDSKSVLGFNLSFFAEEHELISLYLNAILNWIETGVLLPPETKTFPIEQIGIAHQCIQSGLSIGKILIKLND